MRSVISAIFFHIEFAPFLFFNVFSSLLFIALFCESENMVCCMKLIKM